MTTSNPIEEALNDFVRTLGNQSISKRDLNVIQQKVNNAIRSQFREGYDPSRYMPKQLLINLFKYIIQFNMEVDEAFRSALDEYNKLNPSNAKTMEWLQGSSKNKGAKHLSCIYIPEVTDSFFNNDNVYKELEQLNILDRSDVKASKTPYKAVKRISKARTLYDALRLTQAQVKLHEQRITALEEDLHRSHELIDIRIFDLIKAILSNESEQEKQMTVITSVHDYPSLFRLTQYCNNLSKRVRIHLAKRLLNHKDNALTRKEIALSCNVSERSMYS